MSYDTDIYDFLIKHLETIKENNVEAYRASTHTDLTLYEWWVTPHRLEGLPFHDFMMTENARHGAVFGSEVHPSDDAETAARYDLANLKIQRFGDMAIASYTLLTSSAAKEGVKVVAHNESRVIVKINSKWMVVHVHKSPAWQAPHTSPECYI